MIGGALVSSSTAPSFSRIGLGCATFGREIPEATAFGLMDYAIDHGITLFDTAEAYGGGQARAARRKLLGLDDHREVSDEMHSSEKIIGRWLHSRGRRDRVTLVSKVSRDYRRDRVRSALEASLQRLQTDRLDLYLYHACDPDTPVAEANEAMDTVIRDGLTRLGGCSNYDGPQLQTALAESRRTGTNRFAALELNYNLLKPGGDALTVAAREQLRVLAYSPLAAGFLTGKYTPDRTVIPKGTRFDVSPAHINLYFSEDNFRRVALLHALAGRIGVPALQLALAWVFQQPAITTVLVGARNIAHLANALAAEQLPFDPAWSAEISRWAAPAMPPPP